jgi:hypothetical protein
LLKRSLICSLLVEEEAEEEVEKDMLTLVVRQYDFQSRDSMGMSPI